MNTKINKSDIVLLGIFFFCSFILQGIDYYKRGAFLKEYLLDFPSELIALLGIMFCFIFWIIPNYLIKERKYFHFTFFSLLVLIVFGLFDYTIGFWSGENDWTKFPKGLLLIEMMINNMSREIGLPFAFLLTKKFYEGQNQLIETQKRQKENELKLLRGQLDPHFLFNNLNTLDSLIDSDSEKAKEYINRLSLIYRYLIQTKDAEVMELSKELNFAENYIFLIKTRFGNDYEFNIKKNASTDDKFIPTGAIQTLLENVVKHNKPKNGNTVKASICIEDNYLKVSNSKSVITNKNTLGTGLENLKSRYQLLSEKELSIINTESEFKVIIPIINLSD